MTRGKLYLDIETLPPLAWSDDQVDAYVRERVPGTYKKPESIAQWCEENRQEVFGRAALDWRVCRVACIGLVYVVDGAMQTAVLDGGTNDDAERRMLDGMDLILSTWQAYDAVVVGHNVLGFDLPRLHLLAARLRHGLASWFRELNGNPRHRVLDTQRLAFSTSERVSLSDLAAACGVGAKSGHGSEVLEMWMTGKHVELRNYCLQDVLLTREVYRALVGDLAEEAHEAIERRGMNMDRAQVASLIGEAMKGEL